MIISINMYLLTVSLIHIFIPVGHCEPITIPFCQDLPYNRTVMPNLLNHHSQEEAGLEINQYYPLLSLGCSPYLKGFLCSLYAPVCTVLEEALPPCRTLCELVRSGCEEVLTSWGYTWSHSCDRFPESGLCVGESVVDIQTPIITTTSIPGNTVPSSLGMLQSKGK